MKLFFHYLEVLLALLAPQQPAVAGRVPVGARPAPGRGGKALFNTGGPRSRVVTDPLVSALLSRPSKKVGTRRIGGFGLRPESHRGSLRDLVAEALEALGFASPEEAWEALRARLPDRHALVHDNRQPPRELAGREEPREFVRHALVLGRCCGNLFSPERPLILSERRLRRRVALIDLDAETFTREDGHGK